MNYPRRFILLAAILSLILTSACERRLRTTEPASSTAISGNFDFSMIFDGEQRTYKVHVPMGYDATSPMPLVIFLHGGGGSNESMYNEGIDKYSDTHKFIVVAPNGTSRLKNKLLTWNAGIWSGGECCGYAANKHIDDVGFISALIDEIGAKFSIDGMRIFATGISNGGMMAYRLACELPGKIAAVAPVAPPAIPQGCSPARPISIMHIHGTADPCSPYNGGAGGGCLLNTDTTFTALSAREMVDFWIGQDNITSNPTTIFQKGKAACTSQSNENIEVEFCSVEGGGHTWPDGNQYMPVGRIGPVSHDISFDQIWEFFARHQLP